jgi:hypothetical protein
MKTKEEFAQVFEKLVKETEELKEEVRIHEYCRSHGLNYHDSSDYANAVNGRMKERLGAGATAADKPDRDGANNVLLSSNIAIAEMRTSCYNGIEPAETIKRILKDLDNVSHYNYFDDMGDWIKKKRDKIKE